METMVTLGYRLYHNYSGAFRRPYRRGDVLIEGWCGDIEVDAGKLADQVRDPGSLAEIVFGRHNRDDRPDGRFAPSLSVGDVVVVGEVAVSVDRFGWLAVSGDEFAAAEVFPGPWRETRRQAEARALELGHLS
jgi:hypothetical protein